MGASSALTVSQRKSTRDDASQRELRVFGAIPAMDFIDEELLSRCKDFSQALAICWALSRTKPTQDAMATQIGVDNAVMSRIARKPKNRPAYMPERAYAPLCELLGNVGVLQWLAAQVGCRLVPATETRAQKLRRELAALEAADAM